MMFRHNGRLAFANAGLHAGFLRRHCRLGVEHQALGPFMIRMDSNVDLLIGRNLGR